MFEMILTALLFVTISVVYLTQPRAEAGHKAALYFNRGIKAALFLPITYGLLLFGAAVWNVPGALIGVLIALVMYGLFEKGRSNYGKKMRILRMSVLIAVGGVLGVGTLVTASLDVVYGNWDSLAKAFSLNNITEWGFWNAYLAWHKSLDLSEMVGLFIFLVVISLAMTFTTSRKYDGIVLRGLGGRSVAEHQMEMEVSRREYNMSRALLLMTIAYGIGLLFVIPLFLAALFGAVLIFKVLHEPVFPKGSTNPYRVRERATA